MTAGVPMRWRIATALLLLALVVRWMPAGLYVTPDEPIWVERSIRFTDAVAAGAWAEMPQPGHPGLTTMALGGLGVWLTKLLAPVQSASRLAWIQRVAWLAPENGEAFRHLAFFLPAGRFLVALVVSSGITALYLLGRRRFGERAARYLALFLALDPFFAGHGGLLHTDALQAILIALAVVLAYPPRSSPTGVDRDKVSWGRWVGVALLLALAGLTKLLGLLVAPGLALALVIWGRGSLPRRLFRVGLIALLTAGFFLLLYPPFWSDPGEAVRSLAGSVTYHEGIGLRDVFFAGRMRADPGLAFYPAVLLFRLTPPVMVGLVLYVVCRRHRLESGAAMRWGWFVLPTLVYLIALTAATKKFDRYALTVVPLLAAVAAGAWRTIGRRWRWAVLASLVLPWSWVALVPLHYATPLLGGALSARRVVPLGWGEASGFAARRLNRLLPEPASATLMTRNVPGAASRFEGEVRAWSEAGLPCVDAVVGDVAGDVAGTPVAVRVSGRRLTTLWLNAPLPDFADPLLAPGALPGLPPDAAMPVTDTLALYAWLDRRFGDGTPFIWIHAPRCYPLSESQLAGALRAAGTLHCEPVTSSGALAAERCSWTPSSSDGTLEPDSYLARFGEGLDLVAVSAADPEAYPADAELLARVRAPDSLVIRLRWLPRGDLANLDAYLALQPAGVPGLTWLEGGNLLLDGRDWPAASWSVDEVVDAAGYVPLPLHLAPGTYRLLLSLSGPQGWLGLTLPDGSFGGTEYDLGLVEVAPPPYPADLPDLPLPLDRAVPGLRFTGAALATRTVWAGERLRFSLGVERLSGMPVDDLSWHVTCAGGEEAGGPLSWGAGEPDAWPIGHRFLLHFGPRLDLDLPAGGCALAVRAGGSGAGAVTLPLDEITIRQRDRRFEFPASPPLPKRAVVGDFAELAGAATSLPAEAPVQPGTQISVTLFWRALGPAGEDYTVFVHAVGPDGLTWGQSDAWPAGGTAPTTTWIPGEVLLDRHTLTLREDAPPGVYELYTGVYNARQGTRQPLYGEAGRLPEDRLSIVTFEVVEP